MALQAVPVLECRQPGPQLTPWGPHLSPANTLYSRPVQALFDVASPLCLHLDELSLFPLRPAPCSLPMPGIFPHYRWAPWELIHKDTELVTGLWALEHRSYE